MMRDDDDAKDEADDDEVDHDDAGKFIFERHSAYPKLYPNPFLSLDHVLMTKIMTITMILYATGQPSCPTSRTC